MVSEEFRQGATETLDILNHIDNGYKERISKKFIEFLNVNKDPNYKPAFDYTKKINQLNLKEKTKDILSIIYMKYWCNEEQKKNYNKLLKQNEEVYQKELQKKYNIDNVFNNRINREKQNLTTNLTNNSIENTENVSVMEYKESFFSKIVKFFKNIF